MKVIVVGCGRVGSKVAITLCQQGHDVSVIDRVPLAFDKLQGCFTGNMIIGTGIDEDVLVSAGINNADSLISLTKGDNTNIMVGQIAQFIFKVPKVIVRIVDPKSKKFYEEVIGLTCYCPTDISSKHYLDMLEGAV